MNLSVVTICRNAAAVIGGTMEAARQAATDIVVLDSGSTDGTLDILQQLPVRVLHAEWEGFGPTKNKAITAAQYDWILQLDADERIDAEMAAYLQSLPEPPENAVFAMRFRNYLGATPLRHGEWGSDRHIRLFNRKTVKWNDAAVHEELILPAVVQEVQPPGFIHHVTAADRAHLRRKMTYYAQLGAEKYRAKGKPFSRLRMLFSPVVNFLVNYVFKLGFLDGRAGWIVAAESARYTWLKYRLLRN